MRTVLRGSRQKLPLNWWLNVKHYPSWQSRVIHAPNVNLWMAVCCLQQSLKVADILSCRDKQADWIFQLKCNRNPAAPSLAEDYANKLLPTVLCGMLSLIILHSCGPWQTYELHKCLHVEGNIYRSEANMQTATFPCACPGENYPFVKFQTTYFLDQIVRSWKICKHTGNASLSCQYVKRCTVGEDRMIERDVLFSQA